MAAEALREAGLGPVALVPISTVGDRDRRRPFHELGERGIFTKELEEALLDGRVDVAAHSAKDLTTEDVPGLALPAVLAREDPRDAFCGPVGALDELPPGARVGTASMRRTAQLKALRPDLRIEPLRGNVDTRVRRRVERGLDGVVLAACGLDRLGLADEIGFRFSPDQLLPEAGQGFIALQCRDGDAERLAVVGDPLGLQVLRAERLAASQLGGGCRTPVAAHAEPLGDGRLRLRAWVALPDGSRWEEAQGEGSEPEALAGAVVASLLERGRELVAEARG
jgi:hydroxymethylbilane synthase